MKINSTNISLYNKATLSYAFKGIWGEEKYSCRNIPNPDKNSWKSFLWHSDYYQRTYYPFNDEDEATINSNIKNYNNTFTDGEQDYDINWTAIIGSTLPILIEEYKLFKEGKLSSDATKIVERIIKTIVK